MAGSSPEPGAPRGRSVVEPGADPNRYEAMWRTVWANTHAGGPMARTRYRLALAWLQLSPDSAFRLLDVGAGNGAFIARALSRAPALQVFGAEFARAAIEAAPPKIRSRIAPCDLQGRDPLPWGGQFDVVTCMEVLEHLPDDDCAIAHLVDAVAPGGRLLVTVPAWPRNWGPQDEAAGHVRRYEPELLRRRLDAAGIRVDRMAVWGGPLTWLYMRATDRVGPQNVMKVRPTGAIGLAASAIYHALKLDDWVSFRGGEQLLALGEKR